MLSYLFFITTIDIITELIYNNIIIVVTTT